MSAHNTAQQLLLCSYKYKEEGFNHFIVVMRIKAGFASYKDPLILRGFEEGNRLRSDKPDKEIILPGCKSTADGVLWGHEVVGAAPATRTSDNRSRNIAAFIFVFIALLAK